MGRIEAYLAGALVTIALVSAACSGGAEEASARAGEAEASAVRLARAEFEVKGMTCGGCALATEAALRKLDGVTSADARYDDGTGEGRCTVSYDPERIDPRRMMEAIRELGYEPTLLGPANGS